MVTVLLIMEPSIAGMESDLSIKGTITLVVTCSGCVRLCVHVCMFVVLSPKKPEMGHCPNYEFMGVWLSWLEWYVHCTIN